MANTADMTKPQAALRNNTIFPDTEVIESVLLGSYVFYEELISCITGPEFGLIPEWRFYRDGKAWLCKVTDGKKTIFWLSVWDNATAKVSFFFSAGKVHEVLKLDISEDTKERLKQTAPTGKLIPLIIELDSHNIADILKIAALKKRFK